MEIVRWKSSDGNRSMEIVQWKSFDGNRSIEIEPCYYGHWLYLQLIVAPFCQYCVIKPRLNSIASLADIMYVGYIIIILLIILLLLLLLKKLHCGMGKQTKEARKRKVEDKNEVSSSC